MDRVSDPHWRRRRCLCADSIRSRTGGSVRERHAHRKLVVAHSLSSLVPSSPPPPPRGTPKQKKTKKIKIKKAVRNHANFNLLARRRRNLLQHAWWRRLHQRRPEHLLQRPPKVPCPLCAWSKPAGRHI